MQASKTVNVHAGAGTDTGRVLSLDVLRGIAILLVMGRHHFINPRQLGSYFSLLPCGNGMDGQVSTCFSC